MSSSPNTVKTLVLHILIVIAIKAKEVVPTNQSISNANPVFSQFDDWNQIKECSSPLGLIDGRIQDWQLSASSNWVKDPNCNVKYARIHMWPGRGWCADSNATQQYIQIDLGFETAINGIITQGRADGKSWVKNYHLLFSDDANDWVYYNSKQKILGNKDSHSLQYFLLSEIKITRFVRIELISWHNTPGLRLELLGCRRCNSIINYLPRSVYKASSARSWPQDAYCSPENAYIDGSMGWCSKWNNQHQWIAIDLGPPALIVGVVTRGSGAPFRRHWVTSYSISYSNDSLRWIFYKEDSNLTKVKKFDANMDKETKRWHYFESPIIARFIRFNPIAWKTRISMRIGIIGCLNRGLCPNGFFKVNNNSECVQNLAFRRSTWINDKRHSWTNWEFGNSNYAVDGFGDYEKSIQRCALIDNYFVETPIWMVDLTEVVAIHGVVIVSWPQHYQQNNIQKLTIAYDKNSKFITNSNQSLSDSLKTCGHITSDQLRSRSRIHISCETHAIGRYLYIIAIGGDQYSRHLFSAILCEVYVY